MEQLTLWSPDFRASHTQSVDLEKDWMTLGGKSCSNALRPSIESILNGQSSKTSPACFPLTKEGVSRPSSTRWLSCGLGAESLGAFWTRNGLESPRDVDVCSLSSILETGDVPQRYYLTKTACEGILRRAARRGKALPPKLQEALERQAGIDA